MLCPCFILKTLFTCFNILQNCWKEVFELLLLLFFSENIALKSELEELKKAVECRQGDTRQSEVGTCL